MRKKTSILFFVAVKISNSPRWFLINQRGELSTIFLSFQSRKKIPVAVKVLHKNSSSEAQRLLLSEAAIMGQFYHENVVKLCGVVTDNSPVSRLSKLF